MARFLTKFYRVTHCGYYKWGEATAELGGLQQALEALRDWSNGKSLQETRVEARGEGLPSYLFDIREHGACWIVTLWNEVPSDEGKVSSVRGTDLVGGANVQATPLRAGDIPGFATYAAFYPTDKIYVAMKHSDVLAGTEQIKSFLGSYLERSAPWVCVDDSDAEEPEILGYLDVDADDEQPMTDLYPRFAIQVLKKGEQRAQMIRNVEKIRKVIRVRELATVTAPGRAAFQRVLQQMGLEGEPRGRKVRIKQEIPIRLTRDQLVAVLNEVEGQIEPKKNDLAVMYDKDPRQHWLSGMIPHVEIEIAVERSGSVFPAEGLARSMALRRESLLRDAGL